jgi:serine/threonine protein kinase/Tol biopolymer transport system component
LNENNWEQVKDIFQAVIDRPPSEREQFLNEACEGDKNLSDEVRELLDSFEDDDSFFERAAIGEVAEIIVGGREKLKVGEELGRYKIKSALGAGGMGEVFLAEDSGLERLVALKILSAVFSNDGERVQRFIREAKSASALNHPNILTIHEIGQFDDLRFIATEYVKGETLRQRQRREPLNLHETLDAVIQIASALNVAHEAKIIHRDIKPENIMLREDGLVKVLDFGLAKLVEKKKDLDGAAATRVQTSTVEGMLLGTIPYMSPEQARGKATDARTDIWSLGVVLYEMLAGFQPFTGETTSDTIAAILKSEPLALGENTPAELNRIVGQALQKKAGERYQTVKDLLLDLQSLRRELDADAGMWQPISRPNGNFKYRNITDDKSAQLTYPHEQHTTQNTTGKAVTNFKNTAATFTIAALLLAAVGVGLYYLPALLHRSEPFQTMRLAKLTSAGNIVTQQIAISPDGKYAAYVAQEGERQSLWIKHVATSGNVQIIPPDEVQYNDLTFSRDGNYIYYSMMPEKGTTALYQIEVFGGGRRKLLDDAGGYLTFSPDGSRMAFVRGQRTLMIAKADGSEAQTLATAPEGNFRNFLAWSPDGGTIVSSLFSTETTNVTLVETSVKDGTEKPLASPVWARVSGIAWLPDGSGIIVSGRDLDTKISQLWHVAYPQGEPQRITNDLNSYQGVSLTADGGTIVSIQEERLVNIWTSPSSDANLARQVTFEKAGEQGAVGLDWTRDGQIVYTARAAGTQDLWIVNQDGSDNRQLTFNTRSNFSPAVAPDNRQIVFVSDRAGGFSLWKMNADGGNQTQLTAAPGTAASPVWTLDGKWIVYQFGDSSGKSTVWKISSDGGAPIQLTEKVSAKPTMSPDGEFFACVYEDAGPNGAYKIAVIPISGGQPVKLLDLPQIVRSPSFRWSADGRALVYIDSRDRVFNLWSQALDNSPPKQLTSFKTERIFRFDLADDGKGFAVARGSENSDVVMINNFK